MAIKSDVKFTSIVTFAELASRHTLRKNLSRKIYSRYWW